jgi:hypothetical protein
MERKCMGPERDNGMELERTREQKRKLERAHKQECERDIIMSPLHSVAECTIEDCQDCWEFWRDEMADHREGEE